MRKSVRKIQLLSKAYTILKIRRRIRSLSLQLYGTSPSNVRPARFSRNNVYHFRAPNNQRKVIKFAFHSPDNLLKEQRILKLLSDTGLAIPAIEKTQESLPQLFSAFTLMQEFDGQTLAEKADSQKPVIDHYMRRIAAESGITFRQDAKALLPETQFTEDRCRRYLSVKESIEDCHFKPTVEPLKEKWNQHAQYYFSLSMEAFTHGDFHLYQVLTSTQNNICILDWEDVRFGRWQHDVGSMLASIGIFIGSYDRYAKVFMESLREHISIQSEDLDEINFWILTYAFAWIQQRIKQRRYSEVEMIYIFLEESALFK